MPDENPPELTKRNSGLKLALKIIGLTLIIGLAVVIVGFGLLVGFCALSFRH